MNLGEPARSVIPSVAGSVLAALARTTDSLTGRALEARVKPRASHRGVQEALRKLVEAGIVHRVDKGGAALYSLNREHLAAPAIIELARLREELIERMGAEIGGWRVQPSSCVLFGSVARGEGDAESDVDVLVVRPDAVTRDDPIWREQLVELNTRVLAWTGNPLRVVELHEAELEEQIAGEEPYVLNAAREGITLAGTPLSRLAAVAT